jgi:AcrR family transcriptional regulator
MPRVSDAYRQARRDQIVGAALNVLSRRGFNELTMADIIEESGLSAGSVYSNFTRKDEVMELAAARVLGEPLEELKALVSESALSPLEVLRWWLARLEHNGVPFGAVVQIWGEAAFDPVMRDIVRRRMADIEAAFVNAAQHWLAASGRDPASALAIARAMVMLGQGYMVRSAVLGPQDLVASVAAVELLS